MMLLYLSYLATSYFACLLRSRRQPSQAPFLHKGRKLEIVVNGQIYKTALQIVEEHALWLIPPLQLGLPLSFAPQTPVVLCVSTYGGQFTALTTSIGRRTQPQSLIGFQLPRQWHCNQRRQHERTNLSSERPVYVGVGKHTLKGWLQNLSAGGACFHLRTPVPAPCLIQLRLNEERPAIPAKVVGCERVLYHCSYEYRLRVQFQEPLTSVLCTLLLTSR